MNSTFRAYPTYRSTGIEWLGDVPAQWEVRRIGTIAEIRNGATPSTSDTSYWDGDVVWITPDDLGKLHGRYIVDSLRRITEQGYRSCGTSLAPAGSIAISTRAPIGHLGILRSDACVNQGCRLLVPGTEVETEYVHYALSATISALASFGQGSTFTELSRDKLASFALSLPSLPEQRAIVWYLDYVDRRVRRYVAAKRKLIGLLEEERQAVIHQAVTRGLDPNVPLKSSGVAWLGDIPAHWHLRRLKTIGGIRYGLGQPPRELSNGLPLIRATNVSRGKIVEQDMILVDPEDVPKGRNALLSEHEIIVVRSGAYTADSAIVPSEYIGAVSGYDMVVTVRVGLPEFIALALLSSYVHNDQLVIESMRSAQPHLNAEELGSAVILIPPMPEQADIVEHIQKTTTHLDTAIARARRQIELLEEYRTRLIADVVTGKLDVRATAPNLPDEADEETQVATNVN